MGFTSEAQDFFPRRARERGSRYARAGRVEIVARHSTLLVASVRDGGEQRVAVDSADPSCVGAVCTCREFSMDGLCAHVWATLVVAESNGIAPRLPRRGPFEVLADDSLLDLEDGSDPDAPVPVRGAPADGSPVRRGRQPGPGQGRGGCLPVPAWRPKLQSLPRDAVPPLRLSSLSRHAVHQLWYVLDVKRSLEGPAFVVNVEERKLGKSGVWSAALPRRIDERDLKRYPDLRDQAALSLLLARRDPSYVWYSPGYPTHCSSFRVPYDALPALLPALCATGRFYLPAVGDAQERKPIVWDDGPPWQLRLALRRDEGKQAWILEGYLARDGHTLELAAPAILVSSGFIVLDDRVARLDDGGAFAWIVLLRQEKRFEVPLADGEAFLEEVLGQSALPPIDLPEELRLEELRVAPSPRLTIRNGKQGSPVAGRLLAEPSFRYGEAMAAAGLRSTHVTDLERRRVFRRDLEAEKAALRSLFEVGLKPLPAYMTSYATDLDQLLEVNPRRLPSIVASLSARGWRVEAEGKLYRPPGDIRIEVQSGIDWFDLQAEVDFGGQVVRLPALLRALRRNESMVLLDDGTYGMLPREWLLKHGLLLESGEPAGEGVRFRKCHVSFIDALLAAQPAARVDATFEAARRELRSFDGIPPRDAPTGFRGELRPYQKEGLGWMEFLQRFGLGGILADDMGLGKTVQVLALLEARRSDPTVERPSLAVVPRSLVFNWLSEAKRFAPGLRVLDHTGNERSRAAADLEGFDLLLTTYGTLRRDIGFLKDVRFDHVILDEAQAVKNSSTESAKAARLLQGDHRLVMSGTPIENHLGELWSLFEFLNPGMLGAVSAFQKLSRGTGKGDQEFLQVLRRALRPFILRRTKGQVARDLPEKLEQTLYCELEPAERKLYDELREHYRVSLLKKVTAEGLGKAKINVLEALLRLRQAACHTGLIDPGRRGESSAKLDLLLEKLEEVREEGHKVLVFSQFTSLLAIVRSRLEAEKIAYQYLDGQTPAAKREEAVRRFQEDPEARLFLISLKAGGLGLNLTAAEYVFLLDPWWNPAVEAQAIDRAHRIGQTRRVFAYRIVARGTVEEKVLELQRSKRELADAIVSAEGGLLRDLSREDLEMLFS